MNKNKKSILWFKEIDINDIGLVGGKNASLGEMYQNLESKNIPVPNGFAITAYAFGQFLKFNKLEEKIANLLSSVDLGNIKNLLVAGRQIRNLIIKGKIPRSLAIEIEDAYKKLIGRGESGVAVRSSATAEDLPVASFAGQLESFLNVRRKDLLEVVKRCFSSLYTDRAIAYSIEHKFDHAKIAVSVGIQKMVRSDLASSGVMFTLDTETGFRDVILVSAGLGLGENIVKGRIVPDQYYIFKPTLKKNFRPIIGKILGAKELKLIYGKGGSSTINLKTSKGEGEKFALTDNEVLELARWAAIIENHYKKPMDIEWAKDGMENKLYIVQARPETVHAEKNGKILEEYSLERKSEVLLTGTAIGTKIGKGWVKILGSVKEIEKFKEGEVLVAKMTDPDWVPIMKKASAIITESGGRTCHAAIVSRELGIPCVVGVVRACEILKNCQGVTVSCAEGEKGKIYQGLLPVKIKRVNLEKIKRPKTKIMMNVAEPEQAFDFSFIPNDGVGLAREEFIISNYIKIHPLALLKIKDLKLKVQRKIEKLTYGYKDKTKFFVDKLAEGVGRIAAAFYPKPVIVRFSDFKTNEYAGLVGGAEFEPKEANPMIGWRGATRYFDKNYKEAFALECEAIKKVRKVFGLDNIIVMVPFCRTVSGGKRVVSLIKESGLGKSLKLKPLKIYMMVEIPSNVILADQFSDIFDGFSIGSNDLTQLILGVDRDSELVSHLFDERNEAVKRAIQTVIRVAHKKGVKIGICGQAPSDFPDFAEFLVKNKIDSISLNPDSVLKTTLRVLEVEKKLKHH
ncbi:MAG: phosphoenolpyruvate synthase [Patescibacteria group bacterium]|jgi:pyruvate,water dikinase